MGGSNGEASTSSTIFNMVNCIVGSGALTIPYAFSHTGWFGGFFLLSVTAAFSVLSMVYLVLCADKTGIFSYSGVLNYAYGDTGRILAFVAICGNTFGALCAYNVLVGDFFLHVFESITEGDSILTNRVFVTCVFAFCMLCLCFLRNLSSLMYTSVAAIICVSYTVILLLSLAFSGNGTQTSIEVFHADYDYFQAFPLMVVAFTNHYNTLAFYNDLTDRSFKGFMNCVAATATVCFLIYFSIGMGGYGYFFDVESNVLNSFEDGVVSATIAQLGFGFTIVFSYPLVHYALRFNLLELIQPHFWPQTPEIKEGRMLFMGTPIVITLVAMVIALVAGDIGVVLGYTGATTGVLLVYILPPMAFYRIHTMPKPASIHVPLLDDDDLSQPIIVASDKVEASNVSEPTKNFLKKFAPVEAVTGVILGIISVIMLTIPLVQTGEIDPD